jgi:hypothetical protein
MKCVFCTGFLWVCAEHGSYPCGCGAEWTACVCNPTHEMPPETEIIAEIDDGALRSVQ